MDLDFAEMERCIGIKSPQLADLLRRQITQDASFLSSQGVIDYSLLLGVAKITTPKQTTTVAVDDSSIDNMDDSQLAWLEQHEMVLRKSFDALNAAGVFSGNGRAGGSRNDSMSFAQFARALYLHRSSDGQGMSVSNDSQALTLLIPL